MEDKIRNIKKEFPVFSNNPKLIYLDSAATSQKPQTVIDALSNYLSTNVSNVHRGMYDIALRTDQMWLEAHKYIAKYLNASSYEEVFFVKNATEGLNWTVNTIGRKFLKEQDVLVLSPLEHHSNLLPWLKLQKELKFDIRYLKLNEDLTIDVKSLKDLYTDLGERIKIVSIVHQSNLTGNITDIEKISLLTKKFGSILVVDGAQSIAHMQIDVAKLGCDVFTFSGHKVYGPSGSGVVYCKREILKDLEPWVLGGEMVKRVNIQKDEIIFNDLPWKFEAGTPAIEANIALVEALKWFNNKIEELGGWSEYRKYMKDLTNYTKEHLNAISQLTVVNDNREGEGIVTFACKIHPHDVATLLNDFGIAVRVGFHCVEPLHRKLYLNNGTVRVSLGI
ncbi:MAG TPA: cysteine desulfurase, partial [Candidatus Dojkabacteria bacterium]|nr:cysteine desulfurase [Candidatus Dojkabacteria bacterium]